MVPKIDLSPAELEKYEDLQEGTILHPIAALVTVLTERPAPADTKWETVERNGRELLQYTFAHGEETYGSAVPITTRMDPDAARSMLDLHCRRTHADLLVRAAHPDEYAAAFPA